MKVPLLDLKAQYQSIRGDVDRAVAEVFAGQGFILGPVVAACEKDVAAYCGAPHGVGVTSGTDALLIALMAEGIGPGHEVIAPSYTFFATAGSIWRTGAKPVFVDIDPATFNLDPAAVERAVTPKTRAIIPVHLYGQPADMDPILETARRHDLVVIEDACQAIGAEYKGRRVCSLGDYGCLSFFPSKNLGGAGDGGLVTCTDAAKADRVRMLRNHGMEPKYYHQLVGGNFRLDALQAAVVKAKLPHLDAWTSARAANAARYDRLFAEHGLARPAGDAPGASPDAAHPVVLPRADPARTSRHVWNQYVIRVARRDELRAFLAQRDIGTEIYYPVPLHLQACFAELGYKAGDFPESERAAGETLALPVYPELSAEQAAWVVESVAAFYGTAQES